MRGADNQPLIPPDEWLWQPFVLSRDVTCLYGPSGTSVGKSLVAIDLAARVSTGHLLPHIADFPQRRAPFGSVLLLAATGPTAWYQDDPYTITGRLEAAGADLRKCHAIDRPDVTTHQLEAAVEKLGDVKLIVIDPINDFMGKRIFSEPQVRSLLKPLQQLARRHALAVLYVTYCSKRGSVGALGTVPRSSVFIGEYSLDASKRHMIQQKSHLRGSSAVFHFKTSRRSEHVRIVWQRYSKWDWIASERRAMEHYR